MARQIFLCLTLAACSAVAAGHDNMSLVDRIALLVPEEAQSCPVGDVPPPVPPPPRDERAIIAYANRTYLAWKRTEDARTLCSQRLNRIVEIIRGAQQGKATGGYTEAPGGGSIVARQQ